MADEEAIEIRAMTLRWQALSAHWAVTPQEEASLLGGTLDGLADDTAGWGATRLKRRLELLLDLGAALDALMLDRQRIRSWLRRPLVSTNGRSAMTAMGISAAWTRLLLEAATDFLP